MAGIAGIGGWLLPQTIALGDHAGGGPTTTSCTGSTVVDFGDPGTFGQHMDSLVVSFPLNGIPTERTATPAAPLQPGTYLIETVTYDGYNGRETVTQPFEQVVIQPLAADGTVLATSAPTTDVPDFVLEATSVTQLPAITIDQPATAIRARHAYLGTDSTPNSLDVICIGFTLVPPPTTTTTTTTVAPPGPQSTTTTSSIPTEVLPEVIIPVTPGIPVTPVPRPQVVNPTYTG